MAFTQKGNLNTHIKRAHRTELASDGEQQSATPLAPANPLNETFTLFTVNKEHSAAQRSGKVADDVQFL